MTDRVTIPNPFAGQPNLYAPRSTSDTRHEISWPRMTVPAGTPVTPCPFCAAPTYEVTVSEGSVHPVFNVELAPSIVAVDCEPDTAGTVPTDTTDGRGIWHSSVCCVPRPLPARPPQRIIR